MTVEQETITIEMIPVDQIAVINPRIRNKKTFLQIVDSISKVGLKRPITVGRNENGGDEPTYKLVCGQGRLEAFISLGERCHRSLHPTRRHHCDAVLPASLT